MSIAERSLITWASLSLTIFLLSIVFCAVNITRAVYYRLNSDNAISVQRNANSYAMYENRLVDGSTVQYLIDSCAEDMFIRVATETSPVGLTNDSLKDSKNMASLAHINPASKFICTLLYDHNGNIVGLNFEQEGLQLTEDMLRQAIEECRK